MMFGGLIALLLSTSPSQAAEFILPLPGEAIQDSSVAILVRIPRSDAQLQFRLGGPIPLKVLATPLEDGLYSATFPVLPTGRWSLALEVLDAFGTAHPLDSIVFSTTPLPPTLASTLMPGLVAPAEVRDPGLPPPVARTVQSLYLSGNAGWRQGASEGSAESWRTLDPDGRLGERRIILDRQADASVTSIWNWQRGALQLRARGTADLGDAPGLGQPLHRASLDAYWGPWVDLHVGDQNPSWSPLLMDGTRVRGFGAGLSATRDGESWGRVRYLLGWSRRATDLRVESLHSGASDTVGSTFDRFVQAGHIGLGGGERVLWGLTFVHAIDDTTSLSMGGFDALRSSPPRENLGVGTDLQIWLWKRRIEWFGNWATTLVTENIRLGTPSSTNGGAVGLDVFDATSPVVTLNSSTRGLPRLMADQVGASEVSSFVLDNSAARAGLRWTQPFSGTDRMTNELRWVHAGTAWESFLRSSPLANQSGAEFSHLSSWAHDRVFLSSSAGWYAVPRPGASDASRTRISASAQLAQGQAHPGVYLEGGTDATEDPAGPNLETWNAGGGLFRTFRFGEHSATTSVGYGHSLSESRLEKDASPAASVGQDSWNGTVRWKLPAPVELRCGSQFLVDHSAASAYSRSSESTLESLVGSVGASVWPFGRDLELALDASLERQAGEAVADGISRWTESFRSRWSFAGDQSLRLSQRFVQPIEGRGDLRLDLGWEAFF